MSNVKVNPRSIGVIIIILLVLGAGAYLGNQKNVSNPCLSQDSGEKTEDVITKVVGQFESFQNKKNIKLLSTCISKPLTDSFAVHSNPFPFYTIVSYLIDDVSKNSDEKYTVNVKERRLLFKSGISGGSYPEEMKSVSFILEKSDGRWQITSYFSGNNLSLDIGNDTNDWKTYQNKKYGFEFKYPASFTVISEGRNEEQRKVESGETVSSTIQPSLETLSFAVNNSNREIFYLIIFPPRNTRSSITPTDYLEGYLGLGSRCDRRWITSEPHSVKLIKENGLDILEVGIADQLCYFLKNQSGYLLVFNKRNPDDVDSYLKDVVHTLKF